MGAYKESKLSFRGVLTPVAFTNWLWYKTIRPKLEETKAKVIVENVDLDAFGIQDVDEIFAEHMPVQKPPADKDKKDKKDKDDKKDKKGDKDDKKADKKGDKDDKKGKDDKKDDKKK